MKRMADAKSTKTCWRIETMVFGIYFFSLNTLTHSILFSSFFTILFSLYIRWNHRISLRAQKSVCMPVTDNHIVVRTRTISFWRRVDSYHLLIPPTLTYFLISILTVSNLSILSCEVVKDNIYLHVQEKYEYI